jgi:hypothetical protein
MTYVSVVLDVAYEVSGFTGQGDREYLLLSECVLATVLYHHLICFGLYLSSVAFGFFIIIFLLILFHSLSKDGPRFVFTVRSGDLISICG